MGDSEYSLKELLDQIIKYLESASGLKLLVLENGIVTIQQCIDQKKFQFNSAHLSEVLQREDIDGKSFIQINFKNGNKVLFTSTLVGFKPFETVGLDMSKLPKVVTTPDLISVIEALEENMSSDESNESEILLLKKVYQAILYGAENVGFDLRNEKKWLSRIINNHQQGTA